MDLKEISVRASCQSTHHPLFQGLLYALGGNDGSSSLDNCEKYDPYLNRWLRVACMHKRRAGAGVAVLDGYIYVVGKCLHSGKFAPGQYILCASNFLQFKVANGEKKKEET